MLEFENEREFAGYVEDYIRGRENMTKMATDFLYDNIDDSDIYMFAVEDPKIRQLLDPFVNGIDGVKGIVI